MTSTSSDTQGPGLGDETIDPREETLIEPLKKLTMERLREQYPEGVSVRRDAHPKTHGLVTAEFIVLDDF